MYKVLQLCPLTWSLQHSRIHSKHTGRRRTLTIDDIAFITAILCHHPTIYLDELQHELHSRRGVLVSLQTLLRTFSQLHFKRKRISAYALERNEEKRAIFMNSIANIAPDPEMLMFGDEAAKDERTLIRRYGRSRIGMRCIQRKCFVRGKRYSILPILTLDGIITYDIIEGPVTSERFIQFLREHVLPLTNPYPGPRSVLVLDNCRIHHSDEVRRLIEEEALCKLVFLPPYSPDYNPIEQAFSAIKAYLRRHFDDKGLTSMVRACQAITPDKAEGYFRASGYIA